jgi:hypothetical protein
MDWQDDWTDEDEKELDLGPPPPWLHLIPPRGRRWRANEIMRGRNPDPYLGKQLVEAGEWPPKDDDAHRT